AGLRILDLHPATPLEAATTYAVVLTSAVVSESGAPLGRSVGFRKVLRGEAGADVQSVLDHAEEALSISRDEVALAFTFTTQETWQDLLAIRQRLDDGDLPAPTISFVDDPSTAYVEGVFHDGP